MKQIPVTGRVKERLQQAVGDGVDVSKHAVFESTSLNNRPIRQNHPVYKGGIHTRKYMQDMADAVNKESIPVQMMHDGKAINVGRAYHAEVMDDGASTELRTHFFVSGQHPQEIAKINDGTIDQVSVSTLPGKASCNLCGFNFLADDAPYSTWYTGVCPEGHKMGDDAHTILGDMQNFNELSLVNRGGATGARIHSPSMSAIRLAAADPSALNALFDHAKTLTLGERELDLSKETSTMDMAAFATALSAATTDAATAKAQNVTLQAEIVTLKAAATTAGEAATLKADLATRTTELAAAKAETTVALDALKKVAGKVLAMAGQADPALPATPAEILTLVETKAVELQALVGAGGKAKDAVGDVEKTKNLPVTNFRAPPRR